MSEAPQNVRLVLGPVARKLVEGKDGNRGKALDDAIQALVDKAENPSPESDGLSILTTEVAALKDVVRSQGEVIKTLQDIVILEQRMTRIYVASILSEDSDEQQQIIEMAGEAVEGLIERSGVFEGQDLEDLQSREEAAETAIRRELDRGTEELEPKKEPEMER